MPLIRACGNLLTCGIACGDSFSVYRSVQCCLDPGRTRHLASIRALSFFLRLAARVLVVQPATGPDWPWVVWPALRGFPAWRRLCVSPVAVYCTRRFLWYVAMSTLTACNCFTMDWSPNVQQQQQQLVLVLVPILVLVLLLVPALALVLVLVLATVAILAQVTSVAWAKMAAPSPFCSAAH